MRPQIWVGNHQSHETFSQYELKYMMDKEAYARSPFDSEDDGVLDPQFGVESTRKGLTIMEKVGDTPVIKVHGSLTPKFSRYHSWFPGFVTSYEAIKDALLIAKEAGHTDVFMDFSSGGGAVSGLDTVTTLMKNLQAEGMNLHGHTDSHSFSASYWIMSTCDQVTASRMAEVGSIGTLAVVSTLANTEENMGVKFTLFKEGEFKAVGNPYEELTDKDKKYIQSGLKEANSFFLSHISAQRGVSLDDTDSWAEGKTFYAGNAVKNGLIDRITTLDDLIGSGASADTTGDRRKFEMKISAEKLAQIEAGADPKVVLTAAELKQYKTDIEAVSAAAEKEEADKEAAETARLEKEAAEKALADKQAADAANPTGASDLHAALRENGKLEAKVDTLTEKLAEAEKQLAASQAATESLVVLGQAAVNKLQVATGSPIETKSSATEILAQYNVLQGKMVKMFGTPGQKSDNAAVEDTTGTIIAQGLRQKVTQLNTQKR
ncbi:head maturation protease [Pseudomonas phage UAntarctica]|nr:head maturation protease [Pseudomonas phage UAntarctica]